MRAVFIRDYNGIMKSFAGVLFSTAYLMFCGILFAKGINNPVEFSSVDMFLSEAKLLMFLCPLLLTGSFSAEIKDGSYAMLCSSPISQTEIILGKFFAVWTYYISVMAVTVVYLPILGFFLRVKLSEILLVFIAMALLSAVFFAVALFAAAISSNLLTSYAIGVVCILMFYLIDVMLPLYANNGIATAMEIVSVFSAFRSIMSGIIGISDVVRLLSVTAAFLYAARLSLEMRYRTGKDEIND